MGGVAPLPRVPVHVLLELRAALDKQSGIPQQTRLLYRALALSPELRVCGLLQSSTHALGQGVPVGRPGRPVRLAAHRQINRLSRVIIMLEQKYARSILSPVAALVRRIIGGHEVLTRFDPSHFRDYIWQRLFARSLPASDFDLVTGTDYRIARTPWTAMHICGLISRWLGHALYPRLDTAGFNVLLAETPYPATVSGATRLVIRYHDAVPLLQPHTISDRRYHQLFHYQALRRNVGSGAWFVCVSEATRRDLVAVFPEAADRSVTIHNVVSHDYFDEPSSPERVWPIARSRVNARVRQSLSPPARTSFFEGSDPVRAPQYLLIVSTVEPRKNHLTLLSAWEQLRARQLPDMKLIIVGTLGWHHAPIVRKLHPWMELGQVTMLEDVPAPDLRVLYKHAAATVCPSFAEGFDLSGVESMMSGGVVVASDIPVHREVYGDGALYFDPRSPGDLARVLSELLLTPSEGLRAGLIAKGASVARRYTTEVILPKWRDFLLAVAGEVHPARARTAEERPLTSQGAI